MKKMILPIILVGMVFFIWATPGQTAAGHYPKRVISLGPINTENVFLLGAGDRLVANTDYCVRPEGAKDKEKVGSVLQISLEKIIGLRPDLVLATSLTGQHQLKKLKEAGIHVEQFKQSRSFDEICSQFLRLGRLLGLEERARNIVNEARTRVAGVAERVAHLRQEKVFFQIGSQPLYGGTPDSFTHDFIRYSGGVNVIADQKKGTTNFEKIIAKNPDVIIIAIMGSETGVAAEQKKNWMRFSVINAVKNRRVHFVNPNLACSPSPMTFAEMLEIIVELIHPQLSKVKRKPDRQTGR